MPFAIGIDLGTANTRVAVFRNGEVEIIPDEDGNELMPSYVAFGERCRIFGEEAKVHAYRNPKNTIYGIKPFLGRSPAGSHKASEEDYGAKRLIYSMERSDSREFVVTAEYNGRSQQFTVVELLAMLLAKARMNAEAYLSESVSEAVISVPADFSSEQRSHLEMAAGIAGIEILRTCTSIESIALHNYAADDRYGPRLLPHNTERIVVILDYGANSINAGSVVINHGAIRILAQTSESWSGGDDFVQDMALCLLKRFQAQYKVESEDVPMTRHVARNASEGAIQRLALFSSVSIRIHSQDILNGKYDFHTEVTRKDFDRDFDRSPDRMWMDSLVSRTVLNGLSISDVVMVGGCSKVPSILESWKDYFGNTPLFLSPMADVSEVSGSAIRAAMMNGSVGSGKLRDLAICCSLPTSIQVGPIRASTVTSKVLGSLRSLIKDHTISDWRKQTTNTVSHCHGDLPGKWAKTFPIRELDISPSKPVIYIYERIPRTARLLIGELNVASMLSSPSVVTAIKIIVDHGSDLDDIRVTAVCPEAGKVVEFEKMRFKDPSKAERWRASEVKYQQDEQAEAARINDDKAANARRTASRNNDVSQHRLEPPDRLLKTLEQFRSLLGQSGLNLGLISFSEVQGTVERLSRDGQMELATYSRGAVLARIYFVKPEIASTISEVHVVGTPTQVQREHEQFRTPLDCRKQPSTTNGPKTHVESFNIDRASGGDPLINGAVDIPRRSGWDAEQRYTDAELEDIAAYLRNTGHEDWSTVPRIYVVLRTIGHVELIEHFFQRGMTDIWFPFSDTTLPSALTQPSRGRFLQAQGAVLSEALCLEKGINPDNRVSRRTHIRVANEDALPFKVIANLGGGAHGMVDKVVSSLSYRKYVRKRFNKPEVGVNYARKFLHELDLLKSMSHGHCVHLIGSYSDHTHIALIMTPVADCNLETFYELSLVDKDKQTLMRAFFGCLAGAVDYLHRQKVIHQNIKPQNVLVKDNRALLTDFGFANIWKDLTRNSTAAGLSRTCIYTAPEAARGGIKNQAADMWSLGCVFLEMCTVLRGFSISTMRNFFDERTGSTAFHDNVDSVAAWIGKLRGSSPRGDDVALEWVTGMLQESPLARLRPIEVFDRTVVEFQRSRVLFCGMCCVHGKHSVVEMGGNGEGLSSNRYDDV